MHESRVSDCLIEQMNRSAETLAACERTIQASHDVLAGAHLQLERSRALQRQREFLNHLHHPETVWYDTAEPIDQH